VGDWIYYSNGDDDYKLYKIKTDGTGNIKLSDNNSLSIKVAGDWIYYTNSDDNKKMYKTKTDGTGRAGI